MARSSCFDRTEEKIAYEKIRELVGSNHSFYKKYMNDLFKLFTQEAKEAIIRARDEALRLRHEALDCDHLLLALIHNDTAVEICALQKLGVNIVHLRNDLTQKLVSKTQKSHCSDSTDIPFTPCSKDVLRLAIAFARESGDHYIGTEHLLVGIFQEGKNLGVLLLKEYGVTDELVKLVHNTNPFMTISPVFGLLVFVTIIAGYLTYVGRPNPQLTVFLFIVGGWIISLSLHEFGHAIVAFWGGDKSVAHKGYLTLNPIKYVHGILSIVLPLVYLIMGGIGLPGAAVYINPIAMRSRGLHSLTSAAGLIATGILMVILLLPFMIGFADADLLLHVEFWAGLAFLTYLQISALAFNLLPIPGLDGFGTIAPYLPDKISSRVRGFSSYTLIIIFILFFNDSFSQRFWEVIRFITSLVNLDSHLIYQGWSLFQFWTR